MLETFISEVERGMRERGLEPIDVAKLEANA